MMLVIASIKYCSALAVLLFCLIPYNMAYLGPNNCWSHNSLKQSINGKQISKTIQIVATISMLMRAFECNGRPPGTRTLILRFMRAQH